MATNRKMEVEIVAKDKSKAGTQSAASNLDKVAGAAKGVAIAAAAAGVALGTAVVAKSIRLWAVQEQAILQVEQRLKSTGAAAWITSRQMQDMAASLQRTSVYGDETILQMESLLLTFKEINSPQVLERTTRSILDMASAMAASTGGEPDLRSAATMVGKALNDPILGISAMSRAGVQFTEGQKAVIKSMVETGRAAEAQGIILTELESQFGGASGAMGLSGATKQAHNAFGDLFEEFGRGLTSTSQMQTALEELTNYMGDSKTQSNISEFGADMAKVGGALVEVEKIAWKIVKNNPITLMWKAIGEAQKAAGEVAQGIIGGPREEMTLSGLEAFFGSSDQVRKKTAPVAPTGFGGTGISGLPAFGGDISGDEANQIAFEIEQARIDRLIDLNKQFEDDKTAMIMAALGERTDGLEAFYSTDLWMHQENERKKEITTKEKGELALGFMNNLGVAISAGSDKNNRKSFERDKKMNSGLAVINTAVGATKAYQQYGWPWGVAAAAAVVAAGAAQISTINSQSYGGGGAGGSAPGSAGFDIGTDSGPVAQPTGTTGAAQTGVVNNLHVYGNVYGIDHDQLARELIPATAKAKAEGVTA